MIEYRAFRNPDPPMLAAVWNASLSGPRASLVPPRSTGLLEYFTMAKPYFDPAGLVFALDDGKPVGFVHAGFGPAAPGVYAPSYDVGVICSLGVVPSHRRRGVGRELLRRAEEYLRGRGALEILAGPSRPANPFTFALYGGSDSAGFLEGDGQSRPFFERLGYKVAATLGVFRREMQRPYVPTDARFLGLPQRFDIVPATHSRLGFYRECVLGPIEPVEYRLRDRKTQEVAGRIALWDMATFPWSETVVGILEVDVAPPLRRQGLAKFLLAHVLAHLHQQSLDKFEAVADVADAAATGLLRGLLFREVETGHRYKKS